MPELVGKVLSVTPKGMVVLNDDNDEVYMSFKDEDGYNNEVYKDCFKYLGKRIAFLMHKSGYKIDEIDENATGTGQSFTLSNIFFTVDIISIDDGYFRDHFNSILQSGQRLEMVYNNYYSTSSTSTSLSTTTRFNISSQSLNRIWSIFTMGGSYQVTTLGGVTNPTTQTNFDPISYTSTYFTRLGGGTAGSTIAYGSATNNTPVTYNLTNYQFSVNKRYYPNWLPTGEWAYGQMQSSYGHSYDTLGGGSPNLNSLNKWLSSFFLMEHRFDHGSDGPTLISGVNTEGQVTQGYITVNGAVTVGGNVGNGGTYPTNIQNIVFLQTTASLFIGAGRQLQINY